MQVLSVIFIIIAALVLTVATDATPTPSPQSQPSYQSVQDGNQAYVPHAAYPYADSYGPPSGVAYDGYLVPGIAPEYETPKQNLSNSVIPAAQQMLASSIRFLAKMGLFILGGMGLLVVGGIFTTAVCSLTGLCTIQFQNFNLDRESMRALVTPDRVANAAAFVENAVEKYKRLQRAIH